LGRRPDARNWSAKEIVCHLRDVEELFQVRFHMMVALDEPRIWGRARRILSLGGSAAPSTIRSIPGDGQRSDSTSATIHARRCRRSSGAEAKSSRCCGRSCRPSGSGEAYISATAGWLSPIGWPASPLTTTTTSISWPGRSRVGR